MKQSGRTPAPLNVLACLPGGAGTPESRIQRKPIEITKSPFISDFLSDPWWNRYLTSDFDSGVVRQQSPTAQSLPSGFVAAGSARPVSRPSPHCVCFRILAVAVPPAAAHMVRPSLKVHAVPLAALGRVETRQSPAAPALGCINIGLLHVTLASSVSSR